MKRLLVNIAAALCCSLCLTPLQAATGSVVVAVAANFTTPMQRIARAFQADTGYSAQVAFGSSGNLYAQIVHGAPFEVFLSADEDKPKRLEQAGLTVAGSRFTYAQGALVLWSSHPRMVDNSAAVLTHGQFNRLSIANPRLAPYGRAAVQTLKALHVYQAVQTKLVLGENITQTYQFAMSGNADLGLVAKSQVYLDGKLTAGSGWVVPPRYYAPIRQDAVLLVKGRSNPAAQALMQYLRGPRAAAIIRAYGYHQ